MKIFLARNNVQAGPYSLDELNQMLQAGDVLLDDLAWHSPMKEWQKLGQLTGGALVYNPEGANDKATTPNPNQGFGDNVDFKPEENRRISVADLYGQKPIDSTPSQNTTTPVVNVIITEAADTGVKYATIGSRFMAFVINISLYILAILPLIFAFSEVVDMGEIAKLTDYDSMQAYSRSLAARVSQTTMILANILCLALLCVQFLLLIMRGQSFGKLVMGIRIVDAKTNKLPRLGTLLMRTVMIVALYCFAASSFVGIPAIAMLAINYIMASGHPRKQGWHDRMTATIVVKANPSQLDKTKAKS